MDYSLIEQSHMSACCLLLQSDGIPFRSLPSDHIDEILTIGLLPIVNVPLAVLERILELGI